jgi:hypothetical protein
MDEEILDSMDDEIERDYEYDDLDLDNLEDVYDEYYDSEAIGIDGLREQGGIDW